jgi:hypothetical protein
MKQRETTGLLLSLTGGSQRVMSVGYPTTTLRSA